MSNSICFALAQFRCPQNSNYSNKQEKNGKNMGTYEFPIGQNLRAVSIVEYQEYSGDRLCLDKVKLFFQDTAITLLPIADTTVYQLHALTTPRSPLIT
ncbi:MAG: DUF6334 family protein [Hormoscilla sp.]